MIKGAYSTRRPASSPPDVTQTSHWGSRAPSSYQVGGKGTLLPQDQKDAIRAALGLEDGAAQTEGPEAAVEEWAAEMGLAPGVVPAGTTTDLYWVFEDWYRQRYPGQPQFCHWSFTVALRGLGLGKKRRLSKYWVHLFSKAAADACLSARIALGPRPPLNWGLGGLPRAYKGLTRSEEFKDDEYRLRKRREARKRRERKLGRDIEARQTAAGYLIRPRGR